MSSKPPSVEFETQLVTSTLRVYIYHFPCVKKDWVKRPMTSDGESEHD